MPHGGTWKRFVRRSAAGRAHRRAVRADQRQRLQQARAGQVRGRGGGEQQQRARGLERGEQGAVADARRGHLGEQRRVGRGQPDAEVTSRPAIPIVSTPTIPTMSQIVHCPNRRRSRRPSWPSCAIASDGASIPVASAIASGIASSTGIRDASATSGCPSPARASTPAPPSDAEGEYRAPTPGTPASRPRTHPAAVAERDPDRDERRRGRGPGPRARGEGRHVGDDRRRARRAADRDGHREVDEQRASGMNAQPSPNADADAAGTAAALGKAPDQLVIRGGDDGDRGDDERHGGEEVHRGRRRAGAARPESHRPPRRPGRPSPVKAKAMKRASLPDTGIPFGSTTIADQTSRHTWIREYCFGAVSRRRRPPRRARPTTRCRRSASARRRASSRWARSAQETPAPRRRRAAHRNSDEAQPSRTASLWISAAPARIVHAPVSMYPRCSPTATPR